MSKIRVKYIVFLFSIYIFLEMYHDFITYIILDLIDAALQGPCVATCMKMSFSFTFPTDESETHCR